MSSIYHTEAFSKKKKRIVIIFFLRTTSEAIQRFECSNSMVLDGGNSSKIPVKESVGNSS